uniref:OSJNBa0093P23.12 protein n=2 Tax=Oryza TaxID=4527 RepID=Q7X677_ORYSJ|nr:OSJNBa0093P23.12 [Oryza sativa Japonica Group]
MAEMEKTSAARSWRRPRRRSMAWRTAVRGRQWTARSARTAVRPTVGEGGRRGTARIGGQRRRGGATAGRPGGAAAAQRREADEKVRALERVVRLPGLKHEVDDGGEGRERDDEQDEHEEEPGADADAGAAGVAPGARGGCSAGRGARSPAAGRGTP